MQRQEATVITVTESLNIEVLAETNKWSTSYDWVQQTFATHLVSVQIMWWIQETYGHVTFQVIEDDGLNHYDLSSGDFKWKIEGHKELTENGDLHKKVV